MPIDDNPDLRYCLLHQQLQLINCCIARRKKRVKDLASFETLSSYVAQEESPSQNIAEHVSSPETLHGNPLFLLYAETKTGEKVLRLGADRPAGDLLMLETGEPVYSPITQVRHFEFLHFHPYDKGF